MSSDGYSCPVAISRLGRGETSREPQNLRAVTWLLEQPGGPVVVVTPQKDFDSASLKQLVVDPLVAHRTWRGFPASSLAGYRVIHAWPDRQHLNDLWGVEADALVVIEHSEQDTVDWIAEASPVQLIGGRTVGPHADAGDDKPAEPLPNGVEGILEYVARAAAGYSSGLNWNEEDMLKADMMNRPERWVSISVEHARRRCRELGMRPTDVDTVAGFLQRRKQGRRFNVRSSYRDFQFN